MINTGSITAVFSDGRTMELEPIRNFEHTIVREEAPPSFSSLGEVEVTVNGVTLGTINRDQISYEESEDGNITPEIRLNSSQRDFYERAERLQEAISEEEVEVVLEDNSPIAENVERIVVGTSVEPNDSRDFARALSRRYRGATIVTDPENSNILVDGRALTMREINHVHAEVNSHTHRSEFVRPEPTRLTFPEWDELSNANYQPELVVMDQMSPTSIGGITLTPFQEEVLGQVRDAITQGMGIPEELLREANTSETRLRMRQAVEAAETGSATQFLDEYVRAFEPVQLEADRIVAGTIALNESGVTATTTLDAGRTTGHTAIRTDFDPWREEYINPFLESDVQLSMQEEEPIDLREGRDVAFSMGTASSTDRPIGESRPTSYMGSVDPRSYSTRSMYSSNFTFEPKVKGNPYYSWGGIWDNSDMYTEKRILSMSGETIYNKTEGQSANIVVMTKEEYDSYELNNKCNKKRIIDLFGIEEKDYDIKGEISRYISESYMLRTKGHIYIVLSEDAAEETFMRPVDANLINNIIITEGVSTKLVELISSKLN